MSWLPSATTRLIGREEDLTMLQGVLLRPSVRLLTLVGPPGVGKTRLALALAELSAASFADGVAVVRLAPLDGPDLVGGAIARAVDVVESGDRPLVDAIVDRLHTRTFLLVLDNFEHVLPARSVVNALLAACPGLTVLITSRAPTRLYGEHESRISPLGLPDLQQHVTVAALARTPAVMLFMERAQAARPDLNLTPRNARAIAEICMQLDGLPLAIELAAARAKVLSPREILARVTDRFSLLTGGAASQVARHRTLREAIGWSYDLLPSGEQMLFRQLAVFAGGWTVEAAEAISRRQGEAGTDTTSSGHSIDVLDGLESLLDQSLVQADSASEHGEVRLRMLETIREYAVEQLDAHGETADLRGRHLRWCVALAERANLQADGPGWEECLEQLEAEHDNFRVALRWSGSASSDPELGLRLATALSRFWLIRGHHREGRGWLAHLLDRSASRTGTRAAALERAGYLALRQNDYRSATPCFEEALAIWRDLGDHSGLARTLLSFGVLQHHTEEYRQARSLMQESLSLSHDVGDLRGVQQAHLYLADLARDIAEYGAATTAYQEAVDVARRRGDTHGVAYALRGLGHVARVQGDYTQARERLCESLTLLRGLQDRRCIPLCLEGLACTEVGPDWAVRAGQLLGAAHGLRATTGAPPPPAELADYLRTEADARAQLGEARFATAIARGAAMSLDAAIAYALAAPRVAAVGTPAPTSRLSRRRRARPVQPGNGTVGDVGSLPLTPREQEVVLLIARGLSNRQIAEELALSLRTVERHIENVYGRLGITGKAGRAIVTAFAFRHHLTDPA